MNNIKPTIHFETSDNYENAKIKLIDFIKAYQGLTSVEQKQLVSEYAEAIGKTSVFNMMINKLSNMD